MKLSTTLLAVTDINASVGFYEALGFRRQQGGGALAFLSDGDRTFALATKEIAGGMNGAGSVSTAAPATLLVSFAKTNGEVDEILAKASSAGGRLVRPAADGAWGGYSGSFADPDGNVWLAINNPALYRG